MIEKATDSSQQTEEFAQKIAQKLKPGQIVALSGELGSGKTTFIKGLAQGLDVEGEVTSPSYVLMNQYEVPDRVFKLCHFDFYRIEDPSSPPADLMDYLNDGDYLVVIEWADRVKEFLPEDIIKINFKYKGEGKRKITVEGLE